jgi:hypothetical protein
LSPINIRRCASKENNLPECAQNVSKFIAELTQLFPA